MKRDESGNYWPEPSDLPNGCPVCGAKCISTHNNTYTYACGALWWNDRTGRSVSDIPCSHAIQSALNARERLAALKRFVAAADEIGCFAMHNDNCSSLSPDCTCGLREIREEYQSARKDVTK